MTKNIKYQGKKVQIPEKIKVKVYALSLSPLPLPAVSTGHFSECARASGCGRASPYAGAWRNLLID